LAGRVVFWRIIGYLLARRVRLLSLSALYSSGFDTIRRREMPYWLLMTSFFQRYHVQQGNEISEMISCRLV